MSTAVSTNTNLPTLTPRELEVLIICLKSASNTGGIKIDAQRVADEAGFGNANSAIAKWSKIRAKLFGTNASGNEDSNGAGKAPKSKKADDVGAAGKKRRAGPEQTCKPPAKRGRKGKGLLAEEGHVWGSMEKDVEEDDEEPIVKHEGEEKNGEEAENAVVKTEG